MMISPAAPGRPGSWPCIFAAFLARSISPEISSPLRGRGMGVLVGAGLASGFAVGVGLAVALALAEAVTEALALALALALDDAVALGVGEGEGEGLGEGDGLGVTTGEGLGEGVWPAGVGVAARPSSPTRICPRPVAEKWTVVTFFIAETELVRI